MSAVEFNKKGVLEYLSRNQRIKRELAEYLPFIQASISTTMQRFADEVVNRGFKNRVIKTLSGTDGVYSEESFKRALAVEGEEELASLSPGAFFQRVDSLAQRILRPEEYSALPHSTTSTRYENLNRLLKEKNDRALESLGNVLHRQIPSIPHRAEVLRRWFSDPNNQQQLRAIRRLDFSKQNLKVIPPEIGQLVNLRELYLYGNQIKEIPPEIGQLGSLEWLGLNNNQIREIPAQIGRLRNLRELYLYGNQIKEIPSEIGQLGDLQKVYLQNNQIREIPPEIGRLRNLRELSLSNNQISVIPAQIGQLRNLRELYLSDNKIREIPPEIGQLVNLRSLDLDNNQLTQLPVSLGAIVGNLDIFNINNQTPPEFKINY